MEAYDQIAELYRDSKRLPFRQWIERYTLFDLIGDARGLSVLDAACGEGHYTRMLREAGATEVVGIDISAEMVRLAQAEEARRPLGCRYVRADAADYEPERPVDLVLAAYLLNCAPDAAQLFRVLQALHDALKPGGRLVGVNDDVGNLDPSGDKLRKYGLERAPPSKPAEGGAIGYIVTNQDGRQFAFDNYYLLPSTYAAAFRQAGFRDFRWAGIRLHPSQVGDPHWDDFMANSPIIAFTAQR